MKILGPATLLMMLASLPALARGGVGIDCAKASTAVEHSICDNPDYVVADREMAALYGPLLARLAGSAKEHLIKDQERWLGDRDRACTGRMAEVFDCLQRYQARSGLLKTLADGDYPFVSTHELMEIGKVGGIEYSFDATYPQFDGTSPIFPRSTKPSRRVPVDGRPSRFPMPSVAARDKADGISSRPSSCSGPAPASLTWM